MLISYAHDAEGRRMAIALLSVLRELGFDVTSDHDLPLRNPTSLPAWMDDQIANRVVLCVLSPEYLHAFTDAAANSTHKGVRYELRGIHQRIYDHEGRFGCPVIPVAFPQFQMEQAPPTLRALDISRFDPETGNGTDELVARITALEGTGGNGAMSTKEREQVPPSSGRRMFRQVVYHLEEDLPAEQAIELVHESLKLAEDPDLSTELVQAFPRMAEIIKDHGQINLMRTLTAACLAALGSTRPLLSWEHAWEARVLICGTAWYLQRDHRLAEALEAALKGIQLAEHYGDRRIAAYGRQSVGRIQRLLAEDARGQDRDYHLNASTRYLGEATALFCAIDGNQVRRSEAGACLSLSARTQLTRYRLMNDPAALEHAGELVVQAAEHLTADQKKDNFDLRILKAEIAAANRQVTNSRILLGNVIESLISQRGAQYSEILARAYLARARVTLSSRSARTSVLPDLRSAREIFRSQELKHAAAECTWAMLTTDSTAVTKLKITRADLVTLEELAVDPRTRLAAITELERQMATTTGNHPAGRKINWRNLVNQVERYQ